MSILIKNGRVVTAVDDYYADVYIEGETIAAIGRDLQVEAKTVIDATGKLVIPGGIDAHTHLDMPFGGTTSADDFESGTNGWTHGTPNGTIATLDYDDNNRLQDVYDRMCHPVRDGRSFPDFLFK